MSRFDYLLEKISTSKITTEPFNHVYIENFFSEEDFSEITRTNEIASPLAQNDEQLIDGLYKKGYKIINFPGCVTNKEEYIKWHEGKNKNSKIHSAVEGFGVVLRLFKFESSILNELNDFLLSDEFNEVICEKLNIDFSLCTVDGGIQKYLDGYEISPHPDIRKKASTYMVNINPSELSEEMNHHTHYLRLKTSRAYVSEFWRGNKNYERDWLPWEWCETVKQQTKNNSIVIFSPSDDTLHAVKADYNHLLTQRTQLYGNLWYLNSKTQEKADWETLDFSNSQHINNPSINYKGLVTRIKKFVPTTIKTRLRKLSNSNIGKTNIP